MRHLGSACHTRSSTGTLRVRALIPLAAYPSDGRSKALTAQGFRGYLPDSVVNRTSVTVADQYLSSVFAIHAPQYLVGTRLSPNGHFPSSTPGRTRHGSAGLRMHSNPDLALQDVLWRAWTVMAWLDGLDRFESVGR